jgi:nucleoside-diphosphate-sugar epimerase
MEPIRIARRAAATGERRRIVQDVTSERDLAVALSGVDAVVHLAARAHVLHESDPDPAKAFDTVNVGGAQALCTAARTAGVRRIVFLSSIGVNGAQTDGRPFDESDPASPVEPYAVSKWQAELLLQARAREFGLEVVVVRPPLVYGAEVKGNFLRLLRVADSALPLPLGAIRNRRSLIGVENLCELLVLCVASGAAAGQTFLAAEPDVHSTAELIRILRRQLGRPSRVFWAPARLVRTATRIVRAERQFDKLCGSLEVCADKARRELGWVPSVGFEEGIARTVQWYRRHRSAGR